MNGIDYTKQLAKERDYYQDQIKKNRDSTEQRLTANEKRTEDKTKKQLDNFVEDKAEIEKNYQKNVSEIQNKTRQALEDKQSRYQNRINEERDIFTKETSAKSKDFNQRLSDIKDSYQKSFKSERELHQDVQQTDKKRYSKNVNVIKADTEEKLKGYQEQLHGAGADLKDQYNRERTQLVRSHEDRLFATQKDASNKRVELKDRIDADIKKTKEVHAADKEHTQQYASDRLNKMQQKFQERNEATANDYSLRNIEVGEAQQRESKKSNREHQNKISDIQRDFNKQMRFVELEKRRRDTGSGEFAEVMGKQLGLNEKVNTEAKIRKLNTNLVETQRNYQARAGMEQDSFNETLKKENTEATALRERKLNELNAEKLNLVAKEREKAQQQIAIREDLNKSERTAFEHQIAIDQGNNRQRMDKLKENFNTSMKTLEEQHKTAIEDVTKTSNMDKTDFMRRMEENRTKEIFSMKREFGKVMDATVANYEQRLATYQRENEYLKLNMDQKLQNLTDQSERALESQRKVFEDRKVADSKAGQLLMDQRESQLKNTITQLNMNFQKKIDKMQIESDTKLKLLTNDYENKLNELRATTSRELGSKDINHQVEQERIKQAYEADKQRVIAGYESQITTLKATHRDELEQLKDFKRLS